MSTPYRDEFERFEEKVLKTDTCWLWIAGKDRPGYGRFYSDTAKRSIGAHRAAWEFAFGPIPEGMTVDHLCFEPACVNPAHLRLLSRSENCANQRCATWTHCHNGHEFTPENTYLCTAGNGRRLCRACRAERQRGYYARNKTPGERRRPYPPLDERGDARRASWRESTARYRARRAA
jgi:hypothetical protein